MAKIENLEGLVNGSEILDAADSILLSRGNLGICLDPEKVPTADLIIASYHHVCSCLFSPCVIPYGNRSGYLLRVAKAKQPGVHVTEAG